MENEPKNTEQERITKIEEANSWLEANVKKIEVSKDVEVFSDEELSLEDIQFVVATKAQLDRGENKSVRIIVLNKENWPIFMGLLGRDDSQKEFTGRAEEDPIVPADVNQFIVLPSSEVFSQDTPYRQMYLMSPKFKELLNQPNGPEKLYKAIYLRNILSHELAHLYQFSPSEVKDILGSSDTKYDEKFNKSLDTREFVSCMFGLYNLKNNDHQIYDIYIEACERLVQDGTSNAYVLEQAKRSLASNNLLGSLTSQDIDEMLRKNGANPIES